MESGEMTKLMATEFTLMSTVRNTRVIGKMICNTDMVLRLGQTARSMRVTTKMERSMARAPMSGAMGHATLETGLITKSMDRAFTHG